MGKQRLGAVMTDYIPDEHIPAGKGHILKPGDVVRIDVQLTDRETGRPRIWSRYACVLTAGRNRIATINLKLNPEERDTRTVELSRDHVYRIDPSRWPAGVVAMRIKLIHKGVLKLGT